MEITLETIISLLGLLLSGGGGAFFTWRYLRRRAKAEAVGAEIDAAKDLQDMYQQMLTDAKADREDRKQQMEELRTERDTYKQERNELRERFKKLEESLRDLQSEYVRERNETDMKIARLGRKVDALRPLLCGLAATCKLRQPVTISADGEVKPAKTTKRKAKATDEPIEIEPLDIKDM